MFNFWIIFCFLLKFISMIFRFLFVEIYGVLVEMIFILFLGNFICCKCLISWLIFFFWLVKLVFNILCCWILCVIFFVLIFVIFGIWCNFKMLWSVFCCLKLFGCVFVFFIIILFNVGINDLKLFLLIL